MQSIIHFYSDLIGFGLVGERTAAKPFMTSKPLAEFAELGEDDDAYKSVSRVALLPIPGTASTAGGAGDDDRSDRDQRHQIASL